MFSEKERKQKENKYGREKIKKRRLIFPYIFWFYMNERS